MQRSCTGWNKVLTERPREREREGKTSSCEQTVRVLKKRNRTCTTKTIFKKEKKNCAQHVEVQAKMYLIRTFIHTLRSQPWAREWIFLHCTNRWPNRDQILEENCERKIPIQNLVYRKLKLLYQYETSDTVSAESMELFSSQALPHFSGLFSFLCLSVSTYLSSLSLFFCHERLPWARALKRQ